MKGVKIEFFTLHIAFRTVIFFIYHKIHLSDRVPLSLFLSFVMTSVNRSCFWLSVCPGRMKSLLLIGYTDCVVHWSSAWLIRRQLYNMCVQCTHSKNIDMSGDITVYCMQGSIVEPHNICTVSVMFFNRYL